MSLSAHAMTVNLTPCSGATCVTSITGLIAGGMTFDVNIIRGAFDTLYPDPTVIPFWNDQAMATTAAQAMIDAVRAVGGSGACAGATCFTDPYVGFAKPTATTVDVLRANINTDIIDTVTASSTGNILWADFTKVTAMPEPGTLSLLAIGLAGFAWVRRRKIT